jgi:hypothetical protein
MHHLIIEEKGNSSGGMVVLLPNPNSNHSMQGAHGQIKTSMNWSQQEYALIFIAAILDLLSNNVHGLYNWQKGIILIIGLIIHCLFQVGFVLILHIDEFTFSTPALIELFCILID